MYVSSNYLCTATINSRLSKISVALCAMLYVQPLKAIDLYAEACDKSKLMPLVIPNECGHVHFTINPLLTLSYCALLSLLNC